MRAVWGRRLRIAVALVAIVGLIAVLAAFGTMLGIVAAYGSNLPNIDRLSDIEPASTTRIFARDGTLLARLYERDRVYVSITKIPEVMRRAIVASEDERFYQHRGVDIRGIVRAALANYRGERITQGASTITQQLARNLFLSDKQTVERKIQEALLAIEIERYYTKDEILERYLNLIYFGAGAYGVQAASHTYFAKDVSKLTLPEAAMLSGVVAAPSLYSPYVDKIVAAHRQQGVLDRMASAGFITQAQADAAAAQPLRLATARTPGLDSYAYPYFTTYVIAELTRDFGFDQLFHGGLTVYTTLEPRLQNIAQRAVTGGVARGRAEGYGMHQGALVAENPRTGEILAMVGGVGFSPKNQFNRAWQARRQPGSSFKGYVYTAAVDQGVPVTTLYGDTPVTYPAGDGTDYSPKDDDHRFLGWITLRKAFALSRNVVAVKLAHNIGIETVIEYANKMGIKETLGPDLSLALGTSVVSPLEMASGFSTIADGGIYTPPTAVRTVEDKFGSIILDNRYPKRSVAMSAGTAYIMTTMMESVIKEGTGYPNAIIGRPAAGKTGTTSDFRDAWFIGFVPQLTAAVWVGNDDYSRMYESYGGNVPARIWARFMKEALSNSKPLQFGAPPPDVQKIALCADNRRAPPHAGGRYEYFLNGTAPLTYCPVASPAPSQSPGANRPAAGQPAAPAGTASSQPAPEATATATAPPVPEVGEPVARPPTPTPTP